MMVEDEACCGMEAPPNLPKFNVTFDEDYIAELLDTRLLPVLLELECCGSRLLLCIYSTKVDVLNGWPDPVTGRFED